jgi:oligoribonuclease (3'-5' exoribonuclease)
MKLFWIDVETTGNDPHKHELLEVVVAEAELLDPFNVKFIHESVMWFHSDVVKSLDPHVVAMHTKNGLFKECSVEKSTIDAWEAEEQLLKLIPFVDDEEERHVLAGSSVHFDHDFLKARMPKLAKRFSHRHYDVSAMKLFCQSRGMQKLPKNEAHRAKEDVLESIEHAKECERWLRECLR